MKMSLIHSAALAVRVPVQNGHSVEMMHSLIGTCANAEDLFLDLIDYLLSTYGGNSRYASLEECLSVGGSAWMAVKDQKGLQRRVDESAQQSYESAASPSDQAGEELKQAWVNAFSRNPDASDAWDHAIKAVEAVLIPIVVPQQDKAQLGHVVGSLRSQGKRWKFILPGVQMNHDVQPLVSMLDALWPNPDRHANGNQRQPTLEEAQAAVHLAVSIVQWARGNGLMLR
ncbi:hypothetical protein [Streptomyces alfalfae]|uniref:Uncharacterized protein n=1 Tax=Streptomyces alfalfae TaxID=1642299 RepID=A0A7T4TYN7_9ACTN|nr:hypothetical protein [Streptomyces alfalfae]QQC90260.1 hypothetical protein I8755_18980 [Streptomyces alfalfae]